MEEVMQQSDDDDLDSEVPDLLDDEILVEQLRKATIG